MSGPLRYPPGWWEAPEGYFGEEEDNARCELLYTVATRDAHGGWNPIPGVKVHADGIPYPDGVWYEDLPAVEDAAAAYNIEHPGAGAMVATRWVQVEEEEGE